MKFEKFRSIVEFNKKNQNEVTEIIRDFYSNTGIAQDNALLNIPQIVRSEARKRRYLIIELPLKDKEIGAMLYRSDFWGYIFVNSSLSLGNANFSMCHEFYHILENSSIEKQTIELYIGEHYVDDKHERKANLFAGMMLMPKDSFSRMFKQFREEQDGNTDLEVICKLMNFFKVPYMAALIRCYELELLNATGDSLKKLLDNDISVIEAAFEQNWLDKDILKSSERNDYVRLRELVEEFAREAVNDGIMFKDNTQRIIRNMDQIAENILIKGRN